MTPRPGSVNTLVDGSASAAPVDADTAAPALAIPFAAVHHPAVTVLVVAAVSVAVAHILAVDIPAAAAPIPLRCHPMPGPNRPAAPRAPELP